MKITKLERAKKTDRINVFVDNEYNFSVSENTLVKYNLYKDKEISKTEIGEIKKTDIYEFGLTKAIEHVARRPRSRNEIKTYIEQKLYKRKLDEKSKEDIINEVIAKLESLDYINDKTFTEWIVKSRTNQQKKSEKEVVSELIKFGIDKEIYRPILRNYFNSDTKLEIIEKLATKKLKSSRIQRLDSTERKQKTTEYLLRKGFNYSDIKTILNKLNF